MDARVHEQRAWESAWPSLPSVLRLAWPGLADGTSYTVINGDKVPGGSPAFSISAVASSDVTFAVVNGSLENGDTAITVNVGESVKATLDDGRSYTLAVLGITASS